MTWQQLKYGTLVAAGLAVSGTLWYDRTTDEKIYMRDMLEIYQGAKERWYACSPYSYTAGAQLTSVTNTYYTWTNTSPREYTAYTSNGTPYQTAYMERVTNTASTEDGDWFDFSFARRNPFVDGIDKKKIDWGYYVFGGYTQYVASGFAAHDSDINGTYSYVERNTGNINIDGTFSFSVAGIYTNAINDYALCIYGTDKPWCMVVVTNKENWDTPVTAATCLMRDDNAYYADTWYNGTDTATIAGDLVGSGTFTSNMVRGGVARTTVSHSYKHGAAGTSITDYWMNKPLDAITWATRRSMFDSILDAINDCLDVSPPTPGITPFLPASWLNIHRSDSSGIYTNITSTNYYNVNVLTRAVAYTNAGLTGGSFTNATPNVIVRDDLTQRNDFLCELQDMGMFIEDYAVHGTNAYYGYYSSEVSWSDAKAQAIDRAYSNTPSISGAYTYGHAYTNADGDTVWYAGIVLKPFVLEGHYNTNLPTGSFDFYHLLDSISIGTYTNYTADSTVAHTNGGHSGYLGTYDYTTNGGSGYYQPLASTVAKVVLDGVIPEDLPWPNAPTITPATNNYLSKGFSVASQSTANEGVMVTRFAFDHCTNSVP